ncbi:MAG: hypothetical protein KF862_16640 [Chitinophagaceae bacterium]|nr:hypothetical protein [Chitinophagaceae bacterium]
MINQEIALNIAKDYLKQLELKSNCKLVLLLNETVEFDLGWVFFYQSEAFLESGNILDALGGNSPLIVNKYNGSISATGTARPIEEYISEYRAKHTKKKLI